ncbi:unnamed protein product [Dibothriocephalus latus]|uniref:Calreticulin n=1 Tax=Dibothriocephalus latus TaxID=60516 RepID=A0A3P6PQ29_DIBLA|nr:unnamed protein product [Dibothriocephalus latus]
MIALYVLVAQLFALASCGEPIYFEERFLDESLKGWTTSEENKDTLGKFTYASPKSVNDPKEDFGLKTSQDAKFYHMSSMLKTPLDTKGKDLCVQFSVKHEQDIDCGGGYVKLLGKDFVPEKFNGDTNYEIMFGPDICGYGTKKVHLIFSYKGKNHLIKKEVPCKSDTLSHLYTLIVKPDNTYEILIDQESAAKGSLTEDWDMLPPKKINDPNVSKPSDWVDEEQMDDPEDKKPEDWDKPKTIPDPDAKKPDDWDDLTDGEWTAPLIDNPEYKGEWSPKKIPNPAYKGEWVHPQIDNPEYHDDPELYARHITAVGLDLWQVKSGTIFDNFIIATDVEACNKHAQYWKKRFEFEKEEKAKADEEAKKKAKESAPESMPEDMDEAKEDEHETEEKEKKPEATPEEPPKKHVEL